MFEGFENFEYNGVTRQRPILGAQVGGEDTSQGDGRWATCAAKSTRTWIPSTRTKLILGFQTMINDQWSWGVRGTYRKLTNAIDDMEISSTGIMCDGEPVSNGYVMANPGRTATIFSDTDCDGENDAFVDVDTSPAGWAMYDSDGNYLGDQPYEKPRRDLQGIGTRGRPRLGRQMVA